MMKKRALSVLLCLCMAVGALQTITTTVFAVTATPDATGPETIAQLRNRFPAGEYWNHVGDNNWNNPHGYNPLRKACDHSDHYTNCWVRENGCECNYFDGAIQCMGFARRLAYGYYRSYASTWGHDQTLSTLKAGDIVQYGSGTYGHTIWVTAVNGDVVTYADCNGISYNQSDWCKIRWDATISRSTIQSKLKAVYHAPYAATGSSTPSQPTAAAQNLGDDFYAYIRNPHSGHNLENRSNNVQLATANNYDPRQIWHFINLGNNQYKIINMYDGRCLDTNGTDVQVLPYVGNYGQNWSICGTGSYSNSTLYYMVPPLYSADHALVLDVAYGNDDYVPAGRNVQLSKSWYGGSGSGFVNGGPFHKAQAFQIMKVSESEVKSLMAHDAGSNFYSRISFNGSYLQVIDGASSQSFDVRTTQTFSDDSRQIWHFVRQSGGFYIITNEYTDLVLSISGSAAKDHANVYAAPDVNSTAQRWYLMYSSGDSTYRVVSALKYPKELYSLDIDADEGTNAQIYHQNESPNQKFSIVGIPYTKPSAKPAEPTNILEKISDDGIITVTWDKVPNAARYLIILEDKNSGEKIINTYVNGTSYTHNKSLPSGSYKLTVQSVSSANILSDISRVWNISLWYRYTVSVRAGEGGTVSGGGTYEEGKFVTLRATPSSGYRFVEWRLNDRRVSSSASYTFTVSEDQTYTAVFEKQIDTVHGRVTVDALFTPYSPAGELVTLWVIPDAGYQLNSIRVVGPNGRTVSLTGGGNTYTFLMPSFDVSVYVDYVKK